MEDETLLFDQTIKKIDILFRYSGINIRINREISRSDFIKSRIIYIINFFWLQIVVAGEIYWFIDGVRTGKDFLGLTYIAPCLTVSNLSTIKGLLLVLNEKHVQKLVDNLRNMEKKETEREHSKEKMEIIIKERDFLHYVINLFTWMFVIVIVTFAFSPIIMMSVEYSNTAELEFILPFLVLYPFDPFQAKVWPFEYLHQVWSGMENILVYYAIFDFETLASKMLKNSFLVY